MQTVYLEPTRQAGAALFSRQIQGEVVMLNLLRFKTIADYSQHPQLAPADPISGREAYLRYIQHAQPFLQRSGGEILYTGSGGSFFIGPTTEWWDMVMLIKQKSLNDFLQFATNADYLAGLGHRSAALQDSRLLPLETISV
jgi:uncharacterized protein (DUF1330 family)